MKKFGFIFIIFALAISSACKKNTTTSNNTVTPVTPSPVAPTVNNTKKGVGLTESNGYGAAQLKALQASWYYNWGKTTNVSALQNVEFVPMCFSLNGLSSLTQYNNLLGFNEPDNSSQSNMAVADALSSWQQLTAKTVKIGSPASAGNPLTAGSWLETFMAAQPKVDYVCVHWYKGCDTTKFMDDMTGIITKFNKPIWVTEFAPQTVSSSQASPNQYSQAKVDAFIVSVVRWMNKNSMVQRFAWHDSKTGTSALYDANGNLSATGLTYANAN